LWLWDNGPAEPPFSVGPDALFVGFQLVAEWRVFLQLGWPLPARALDLYIEFLHETNDGRPRAKGTTGLLAALSYHHIPGITSEQKAEGRALAIRGGPYTDAERRYLLGYCQTDVDPLAALLERMLPRIRAFPHGLAQALIRGRYAAAEARMTNTGVPIDGELLNRIRLHRKGLRADLIREVDPQYSVYYEGRFSYNLFDRYLAKNKMEWPRTPAGYADLDAETLKDMTLRYPQMEDFRQLRKTLSRLKSEKLAVGPDNRNRAWLASFRALTSRHTTPNSEYIFGQSAWMRGLIRPTEGKSIVLLDWRSQEVFVAAQLSNDRKLLDVIQHGDPYLTLAAMAGLAPPDATKQSHGAVREVYKTAFLAVAYGQGAESLAMRTGLSLIEARDLIRELRHRFPDFYDWAEHTVDVGQLAGYLTTSLGWRLQVGDIKPTTTRNFPVQANGAEMLRLACCLATERGVAVCGPIHDAVLAEAGSDEIDDAISATVAAMSEASRVVLGGIETDVEVAAVVRGPGRLLSESGRPMWDLVMGLLARREASTDEERGG
jgi:DNA polymerase I-like protein with 3'-5' exonuclease and polymerase domains